MSEKWEYCLVTGAPRGAGGTIYFCKPRGQWKTVNVRGQTPNGDWNSLVAQLGEYGWELAGISSDTFYFKRPMQDGRATDDAAGEF